MTITYVYDKLYRLTAADYSDGRYIHYTYDPVGNRLSEVKCAILPCTTPVTNTYEYDAANRLTQVNSQAYAWDNNGNLLDDGPNTYDAANRLTSFTDGTHNSSYIYSGLGDRLSQTVDSVTTDYVLDLNAGLTQVLDDGTNTYLYGNGRIGELQPGGFAYHLGDGLESVRQLTNEDGAVTLARSYEPFGDGLSSAGSAIGVFSFAGEQADSTGLSFNRARYYSSGLGRFLSHDPWAGDVTMPNTLHPYSYGANNPVMYTDPSGLCFNWSVNSGFSEREGVNPITGPCPRSTLASIVNSPDKRIAVEENYGFSYDAFYAQLTYSGVPQELIGRFPNPMRSGGNSCQPSFQLIREFQQGDRLRG